MTSSKLSLALCVAFLPVLPAVAAEHRPAPAPAALVAAAEPPAPVAPHAALIQPVAVTAAVASEELESLPELPAMQAAPLRFDAGRTGDLTVPRPASGETRFTVSYAPKAPSGLSMLESMPLAGTAARRMGANRFNTDDGSSMDAFAICYRLNGRSSVQVIPGDPAPVKIPVTSMANNMGVTVGMVLKLSKNRSR